MTHKNLNILKKRLTYKKRFLQFILFCLALLTIQDAFASEEGSLGYSPRASLHAPLLARNDHGQDTEDHRHEIDDHILKSQEALLEERGVRGDSIPSAQDHHGDQRIGTLEDISSQPSAYPTALPPVPSAQAFSINTGDGGGDPDLPLLDGDSYQSTNPLIVLENRACGRFFRWAHLDSFLERSLYALVLRDNALKPHGRNKSCASPFWVRGGSFPVESDKARRYVLFVDGLRQGTEFVVDRAVHMGILVLLGYQLDQYFKYHSSLPCHKHFHQQNFFKFLFSSDKRVFLGIFHDIFGTQNPILPSLKYLLITPFAWGLVKGIWNARKPNLSHEETQGLIKDLRDDYLPSHHRPSSLLSRSWHDTIRWILPVHPMNRKMSLLIKNFLWNPHMEDQGLRDIWGLLEGLIRRRGGYTPLPLLGHVMKVAYGLNLQDAKTLRHALGSIGENSPSDQGGYTRQDDDGDMEEDSAFLRTLETRLELKEEAYKLLKEFSGFIQTQREKIRQEMTGDAVGRRANPGESSTSKRNWGKRKWQLPSLITPLYANYLLWSLGVSNSWTQTALQTSFKAAKLFIEIQMIRGLIEGLKEAKECPQRAGVSVGGVKPWAYDLTQECFEAAVNIFNRIPGQPVSTLVGNLDRYYFPNCTIDLDLSGKGLNGNTTAEIIQALQTYGMSIPFVNLAGNNLRTPEDFNAVMPLLTDVVSLNLSNYYIDGIDTRGSFTLAQRVSQLTQLTLLDLSNNNIGSFSNVTLALGQSLAHLSNLTILSMNGSPVEYYVNSNAGKEFALGISKLTQLNSLNLGGTNIGEGNNGTNLISLFNAFNHLRNLKYLNLSDMCIGSWDYDFFSVLASSFPRLKNLEILDLSYTSLGYKNDNGTIVLAQNIPLLKKLRAINLANNFIDTSSNKGSKFLINSLGKMKNLTRVDLSYNNLSNESIPLLINALKKLSFLESLNVVPQGKPLSNIYPTNPITYESILELNQSFQDKLLYPIPTMITSQIDVEVFCNRLLFLNTKNAFLSRAFYQIINSNRLKYVLNSLFQCLKKLPHLTGIDFSHNFIGFSDAEVLIILSNGLLNLDQLQYLDLSGNFIGYHNPDGPTAIAKALTNLQKLQYLDLSGNLIGYHNPDGPTVIAEALAHLQKLKYLDLYGNYIGYNRSSGLIALGKSFTKLIKLTSLRVAEPYSAVIKSYNLPGIIAFSKGLSNLKKLKCLDIGLALGSVTSNITVTFSRSLSNLKNLEFLGLRNNQIGRYDSRGSLALAQSFYEMPRLKTLDLSGWGNDIGSQGPEGPIAIFEALESLPHFDFANLKGISYMTNISWTNSSGVYERARFSSLIEACQHSQCFGGDIAPSTSQYSSYAVSPPESYADTTALVQPSRRLRLSAPTRLTGNTTTVLEHSIDDKALVVWEEQPASYSIQEIGFEMGSAMIKGAALAALPEAIGDSLTLSGTMKPEVAEQIKITLNTALMAATGSWMGASVSWITTHGLRYMGVSDTTSRVAGTAAGFLTNTTFTPWGATLTALNYGAGMLGIMAEKKLMTTVFQKKSHA